MRFFAASDIGNVREENEDAVFATKDAVGRLPNLFIVADGMGGQRGGRYAAQFAVRRLPELIAANTKERPVTILREAVAQANAELFREGSSNPQLSGMGTTLVIATLIGGVLYVVNIGDSRLYLKRDTLRQITRDHSWVEELVDKGWIDRGSSVYREKKNIITRALGAHEQVNPDLFEVNLKAGDLFFLCSDGLTNMLDDDTILRIIEENGTPEEAVRALIENGKARGGRDNLSIVLVNPELSEVDSWC